MGAEALELNAFSFARLRMSSLSLEYSESEALSADPVAAKGLADEGRCFIGVAVDPILMRCLKQVRQDQIPHTQFLLPTHSRMCYNSTMILNNKKKRAPSGYRVTSINRQTALIKENNYASIDLIECLGQGSLSSLHLQR